VPLLWMDTAIMTVIGRALGNGDVVAEHQKADNVKALTEADDSRRVRYVRLQTRAPSELTVCLTL